MKNKVCIMAEAGVNHNGNIDLALKLCDIAKDTGTDIVKFQTFNPGLNVMKNVRNGGISEIEYKRLKISLGYD